MHDSHKSSKGHIVCEDTVIEEIMSNNIKINMSFMMEGFMNLKLNTF